MSDALRVIPLGGVGEIGKNMLALEQGDDIVVIDAGLMFPDEEMLGIDLVIPDITYLKQNKKKVRGIVLTHAHEDHMGALPYVLRDLPDVPIYGTKLTLGLMRTKLREHKLADKVDAREFAPGSPFKVGAFACDSYAVCHSIPDAVGITLETRYGTVVHSGDWKFDHTPVDGRQTVQAAAGRVNGCVKVLPGHQHHPEMTGSPLDSGQPALPFDLCGTATGVPACPRRVEREQIPALGRAQKDEIPVLEVDTPHAEEPGVES